MQIDESIAQLGKQLDVWFETNFESLTSNDSAVQRKALVDGIELAKQLDCIKSDGLRTLARLILEARNATDGEHVASLVSAFELGARLKHTLSDELSDTDGANAAVRQTNAIADALDAIGTGRRLALVPLLEHLDAGVRASAGAYLVGLIPDQALPVLRQVSDSECANSAHFTAFWAIAG